MTGRSPQRPGPRSLAKGAPVRATPGRGTPVRATPVRGTPVRGTPARGTPARGTPGRKARPAPGGSAQRFVERARRRRRNRLALVVSALTLGLAGSWLLFGSPFLAVERVEVRGLHRVPMERIRGAADPELGRPMALISPQQVAERALKVPLVLSARVERAWPDTLVVTVVEREPIAAVPAGAGRFALVDGDGVTVTTTGSVPADLPRLDVDVRRAGAPALRAARQVYDALPARIRPTVRRITAPSPDSVSVLLSDGSTVLWGSAQDSADKAAALLAVHPRPLAHPATIDISAPDAPAVTTTVPR